MRLSLRRGAVIIAVIAALGVGLATAQKALAGIKEGRAAILASDYPKAVAELQPLANQGDPVAEYLLAEIYFGGHGGTLAESVKWMTASARWKKANGPLLFAGMGILLT